MTKVSIGLLGAARLAVSWHGMYSLRAPLTLSNWAMCMMWMRNVCRIFRPPAE